MNYEKDKEKPAYVDKPHEVMRKELAFDPAEVLAEAERVFPAIAGEFAVEDLDEVFEADRQQNASGDSDLEDLVYRLGRTLKNALRARRKALSGETVDVTDPRTGKKGKGRFKPDDFDKKGMDLWRQAQKDRNAVERAAAAEQAEQAGDAFAKASPEEQKKILDKAKKRLAELGEG